MPALRTLARGSLFHYDGTFTDGFSIHMGRGHRAVVTANTLEQLIAHFSRQPHPVPIGASRTQPPEGSLGAWLIAHRSGASQVASYLAAILVQEGHAALAGGKLVFVRPAG
jgi:hypothetical protein